VFAAEESGGALHSFESATGGRMTMDTELRPRVSM
jgi:hypothetical protein